MRNKYILVGLVGIAVGVLLTSVVVVLAGNPLGPGSAPGATFSYTLEDIYDRLDSGADGAPSAWSEPGVAPGVESGPTLSETMALAPKINASGAVSTEVATGKTFWGLTTGEWGLQTGTAAGGGATCKAGVPSTGQTISYTVGDDGDLEKGVAWPNPRFITGTTGVVTDTLTGLIWLENANCWGQQVWATAIVSATALSSGECGLSDGSAGGDWRLPNVREQYSLIHSGFFNPAVPDTAGTGQWSAGDPFTGVQSSNYWSSTTDAGYTDYAWFVYLYDGRVRYGNKAYDYYVWPVRGGQ